MAGVGGIPQNMQGFNFGGGASTMGANGWNTGNVSAVKADDNTLKAFDPTTMASTYKAPTPQANTGFTAAGMSASGLPEYMTNWLSSGAPGNVPTSSSTGIATEQSKAGEQYVAKHPGVDTSGDMKYVKPTTTAKPATTTPGATTPTGAPWEPRYGPAPVVLDWNGKPIPQATLEQIVNQGYWGNQSQYLGKDQGAAFESFQRWMLGEAGMNKTMKNAEAGMYGQNKAPTMRPTPSNPYGLPPQGAYGYGPNALNWS